MKKTDIIIFGGQSNMQGETDCLTENEVVSGAYEYKYLDKKLVELKNPVGENITVEKKPGYYVVKGEGQKWLAEHITGGACKGYTNMVPEFCREYIRLTGKDVVAVHTAKGSTEIAQWMPGSLGYELIVEKTTAAIEKAKAAGFEIDKILIVWLQGESDAVFSKSKAYYKESITVLNEALKKDLNLNKFGIIRVGRFVRDERDDEIINAQEEICAENPDFAMLTRKTEELTSIPEYMNQNVPGHYSSRGQEVLGKAAAEGLAKAL